MNNTVSTVQKVISGGHNISLELHLYCRFWCEQVKPRSKSMVTGDHEQISKGHKTVSGVLKIITHIPETYFSLCLFPEFIYVL